MRLFSKKNPGIMEKGKALVTDRDKTLNNSWAITDDDDRTDVWKKYNNAYHNFGIIRAAIDITTDQAVQDFYFEERDSEELKKSSNIKKAEEFTREHNLLIFFKRVCKQLLIYGNCFVEVVGSESKVDEFKILNPTSMHVLRKKTGSIIGYYQKVKNKTLLWGKGFNKDSKVKKVGNKEDILHFKYNVQKSEKYGTGIIHSILPMLGIKEQVEENLLRLLERYAIPFLDIAVGDAENPPTQNDIDTVDSKVQQLDKETQFVHSHLIETNTKGFEGKSLNLEAPLNHIDKQIIAGLQCPPILMGISEGIDRATAEVQLRSFGRHVKSIQRIIKINFEDKIISKFLNEKLELKWGSVEEREKETDFEMLKGLVSAGIITPQKANSLLPPKYRETLPKSPQSPGKDDGNIPKKEVPTDPTKSTQLRKGRRVKKTDVKVPMDKKTKGEVKSQ